MLLNRFNGCSYYDYYNMYLLIYTVHDWRIRIQLDASTEKDEIEEHLKNITVCLKTSKLLCSNVCQGIHRKGGAMGLKPHLN